MVDNYYKVVLKGLRSFHKNYLSLTFKRVSVNLDFNKQFTQEILNSNLYQSKTRLVQNINTVQFLGNFENSSKYVSYKILLFIKKEKERGAFLFGVLKNKNEELVGCWILNNKTSSCLEDVIEQHLADFVNKSDSFAKIIIIY